MGIGRTRRYSLAGEAGSRFWIEERRYPAIACISRRAVGRPRHDRVRLPRLRRDGEPSVVQVDQEWDYRITVLAPNFVSFTQALRPESEYGQD